MCQRTQCSRASLHPEEEHVWWSEWEALLEEMIIFVPEACGPARRVCLFATHWPYSLIAFWEALVWANHSSTCIFLSLSTAITCSEVSSPESCPQGSPCCQPLSHSYYHIGLPKSSQYWISSHPPQKSPKLNTHRVKHKPSHAILTWLFHPLLSPWTL